MEQEIQTIVINYESDIKQSDANRLNALADALEKLDKVNIDDSNAQKLKNIGDALSGFKSFRVDKGFGDGIDEVVKTINKLETVKDITPFADNLVNGFNAVSKATEGFQTKMGTNINKNLGDGVIGLVNAINSISEVKDITHQADNLKKGFNVINEATETFKGGSLAKLNSNLGVGVTNLVNAINSISEVKDITHHADSLNKGFDTIGRATESFQTRIGAKISGNLGDGITGLINAINKITEVKDITPYASNMQYSFSVISTAVSHFSGMELNKLGKIGENVDSLVNTINRITEIKDISIYAHLLSQNFEVLANALSHFVGMDLSKLRNIDSIVNAFNNLGTIKPIDETIIKNAEMLAKAINTLDKSVGTSDTRLKALGSATRAVGRDFNNGSKSVEKFNKSLNIMQIAGTIWAIQKVARTMKSLISTVYGFVDAFGDVQNTLSFFNQSLEGEAPRIANIIQQYSDAGVIDFAEFSNQVSKLNQMYKSYGIAAEDAATMALSMTQVAYDASYALGENGKDIELWLNRITSMSTGQIRSGYYLGLDLSVQSLSESFEGLTNNADKATKVTAMYDEVMRQTVAIQGQMVREIENTYVRANILSNRFRHLKQSIGQALIPTFESLIEIAMISIKVIELLFNAIASLWGGEFKLLDYGAMINDMASSSGGMSSIADSAEDLSSGIGNANKQAKELKKTISGIDQVFTINDMKAPDAAGGGGAAGGIGGIGGGVGGYDWLDELAKSANVEYLQSIEEKAQGISNAIQKWFPWVLTAAAAFQAMKFSKKFIDNLKWISDTKDIFGGLGLGKFTAGLGIGLLIDDVLKFKDALDKLLAGDTSLMNLSKMVGSFSGIMGDLMLITGNWKGAAVFIAIEGLTKVVGAISDMTKNGINPQNLSLALDGVGAVLISFGLYQTILNKNPQILGLGLIFTGISNVIGQFDALWKGITTGDWSDVDKVQLFIGAIMIVGGALVAFGTFNNLLKGVGGKKEIIEVPKTFGTVDTSVVETGNKMKDLAKNLGWVVIIAAEVVTIGLIFVGGIWLIGELMQNVVEAWKPVIKDGGTAAIAIGVGTGLLVAVGLVAYALGSGGAGIAANIAIGGAILLLIGAEALLFVGYVWAMGELLNKVIEAWTPVLNNGDIAKNAILISTGLLVGIGVVTAALGTATVASAGLLPVAIGLGTAMLIGLTEATKLFVVEIGSLADTMVKDLHPPLVRLNAILPTLSTNMEDYVDYMKVFAGHTVSLTKSNVVSGLSGTINKIVGWFTKDPIKSMADNVKKNEKQFRTLNSNLDIVNPLVQRGNELMLIYFGLLDTLKNNADKVASIGTPATIGTNFKDFAKALKDGFDDLAKAKTDNVSKIMSALSSLDLGKFRGIGTSIVQAMELGINNYSFNFTSATSKIRTGLTFNATSIGTKMAQQLVSGINSSSANASTFTNKVKSSMTVNMTSIGSKMAQQVVSGVNSSGASVGTFTNRIRSGLNTNTYSIGSDIARGVVNGINGYYPNITTFTNSLKNGMKRAFNIHSPSRWARDVIGAMIGEGTEDGINETKVDVGLFKSNIAKELDGFDVKPSVEMPTLDTRSFYQTLDKNAMNMNTNVQSKYDIDSDKTARSVNEMKDTMVGLLQDLIDAVDEKETGIQASDIVKIAERGIKDNIVRNNKV